MLSEQMPLRILLVEDNLVNQKLALTILSIYIRTGQSSLHSIQHRQTAVNLILCVVVGQPQPQEAAALLHPHTLADR